MFILAGATFRKRIAMHSAATRSTDVAGDSNVQRNSVQHVCQRSVADIIQCCCDGTVIVWPVGEILSGWGRAFSLSVL